MVGALITNALLAVGLFAALPWNPTQLQKLENPPSAYSFSVMGDHRDGEPVFRRLLPLLKGDRFAVHTGDLVSTGQPYQYSTLMTDLRSSPVPMLTTVGNHDIKNGGRALYNRLLGADHYAFDQGSARFVVLDNATAKLGDAQLTFLEEKLKSAPRYKFVFMHMPPYTPWWKFSGFGGSDWARLHALAKQYKVDRVFFGHLHLYDRRVIDGVPYVITGGAGSPLYQIPGFYDKQGGSFHHFIRVWVGPEGVRDEIVKF